MPEPGKLTVVDVRARPAPLAGGNGAAFLTVLNGLAADVRLTGVTGDAAQAVELHETVNDNGVMKMEPHPEGFAIPAGGVLELKPGGKHVMLVGLTKPLPVGDSLDLTLNFEGAEPITLTVPVVDMQATMPRSHPRSRSRNPWGMRSGGRRLAETAEASVVPPDLVPPTPPTP